MPRELTRPPDKSIETIRVQHNRHIRPKPPLPLGASPLGECPAETPAERMLEELLLKPDAEINLGMAAYLVAADLPAFINLPPQRFTAELDRMTERVQSIMTKGDFANATAETSTSAVMT